jgi:hypothetical protein
MLAITAGFGGAAGVIAYGVAVGVTVAILMVGLVELVGAYRHETETTETTETTSVQTESVQSEPQWSGPDTVELPRQPDTVPFEVEPEPEPRKLEPVGWSVDQIVADLRERGETDVDRRGFQRFVRDTYSVGPGKATKVIDTLKPQAVAS